MGEPESYHLLSPPLGKLFQLPVIFQSLQEVQKSRSAVVAKMKGAAADQKTAAKASLSFICVVICCIVLLKPKTFKRHFESMYPKSSMVAVLVDVQA
uniref:Uncharacterized protein n=1 Tax=Oncorhynchus mykiss TaxID=8022 RepID=A0A8K9XYC4_ONCMY